MCQYLCYDANQIIQLKCEYLHEHLLVVGVLTVVWLSAQLLHLQQQIPVADDLEQTRLERDGQPGEKESRISQLTLMNHIIETQRSEVLDGHLIPRLIELTILKTNDDKASVFLFFQVGSTGLAKLQEH